MSKKIKNNKVQATSAIILANALIAQAFVGAFDAPTRSGHHHPR